MSTAETRVEDHSFVLNPLSRISITMTLRNFIIRPAPVVVHCSKIELVQLFLRHSMEQIIEYMKVTSLLESDKDEMKQLRYGKVQRDKAKMKHSINTRSVLSTPYHFNNKITHKIKHEWKSPATLILYWERYKHVLNAGHIYTGKYSKYKALTFLCRMTLIFSSKYSETEAGM